MPTYRKKYGRKTAKYRRKTRKYGGTGSRLRRAYETALETIKNLRVQNAALMKDRKLFLGEGSRYTYETINGIKSRRRRRKSTYLEKLYDGLKKPLRTNKWLQGKKKQYEILREYLPATEESFTANDNGMRSADI